jgi:hypothetical protein
MRQWSDLVIISGMLWQALALACHNYFKLRDVGEVFDLAVLWNKAEQTIVIDTANSYTMD